MRFIHAEIDAIMLDIHVELFKTILVQQHLDPLARGQLAFAMLGVDATLPPAHARALALGFKLFDNGELRHRHISPVSTRTAYSGSVPSFAIFRKCKFANLQITTSQIRNGHIKTSVRPE